MRLLAHVEGETEESFVNDVLRPHLLTLGYSSVSARLLGNARARLRRGGIRSWDVVRGDIVRHLAGDQGCIATCMVDYYALPSSWPGRSDAILLPISQRGSYVQQAILGDLAGRSPYGARFEPFVIMHEFEALLFSDCERFARGVGHPEKAAALAGVRALFQNPEEINDSAATAPSKRLVALIPGYIKPIFGVLAALEIGLASMRRECPHFADWLGRLEMRVAN